MLQADIYSSYEQIPLLVFVNEDDEILLNCPDAHWYRTLKHLAWLDYRDVAAAYYDALYHFNQTRDNTSVNHDSPCDETKQEATQRLLWDRPTVNKAASVLFEPEYQAVARSTVSPCSIAPGITPERFGGKKPKCFFALLKAFIGANLMGFASEPANVHALVSSNLSYARVCGFVPKGEQDRYWLKHVPSLRKLEQFDQIMRDYGLWDRIKREELRRNIEQGVIKEENVLVGDTTHYHAISGFETVSYTDEKAKQKTKSQSKVTKNCRCADQHACDHPWQLADEGAGTIVKAKKKMIWGHKASVIGLPLQGVPLDAAAVADAATFDGETFFPHVQRLFDDLPEVKSWIDIALYDSACDSQPLKDKFRNELDIELKASVNPRRRKDVTQDLPRGMEKLTPYGNMVCKAGFEMDYKGARYDSEKFIYQAPVNDTGVCVCTQCEQKPICCPLSDKGRTATISFDILAHIDPHDPPMAKRFKAMMTRRPSIERTIKRLKCDLSDDRLTKRGNASFQANLDKTMIAFHILLRN